MRNAIRRDPDTGKRHVTSRMYPLRHLPALLSIHASATARNNALTTGADLLMANWDGGFASAYISTAYQPRHVPITVAVRPNEKRSAHRCFHDAVFERRRTDVRRTGARRDQLYVNDRTKTASSKLVLEHYMYTVYTFITYIKRREPASVEIRRFKNSQRISASETLQTATESDACDLRRKVSRHGHQYKDSIGR
jgi:hypothetical protein